MHGMKFWFGKTVWQNHSTRTIERETLLKGVNVLLLFLCINNAWMAKHWQINGQLFCAMR